VLGYFALGSALIIFGSWFAGAWGDARSGETFFPFVLFFGGVGQFAAAMWSFRARDAAGAALHGSWSAFWLGWGLMELLAATGTVSLPARGVAFPSLGQWFVYMAVITWTTAFAALARSPGGFLAQAALATGATIAAAALLAPSPGWAEVAGWLFVAAAALGFYVGAALMLDNVYGIVVLPLLRWRGAKETRPIEYEQGDPGVKVGQ
jgi:succinate-acetate transporter protein